MCPSTMSGFLCSGGVEPSSEGLGVPCAGEWAAGSRLSRDRSGLRSEQALRGLRETGALAWGMLGAGVWCSAWKGPGGKAQKGVVGSEGPRWAPSSCSFALT